MFCPKCGKSEQTPESYCRKCGVFLPDLSKPLKKSQTPEEHVKINTVLSAMTVVASFTLAILLYSMLAFRPDTHWLIYMTAGLLIAIGGWHIQSLWRTHQLRKHFKKNQRPPEIEGVAAKTGNLLQQADFENVIPTVTDHTTKLLSETKLRSS